MSAWTADRVMVDRLVIDAPGEWLVLLGLMLLVLTLAEHWRAR